MAFLLRHKHNKNKDGEVIVAEEKEERYVFKCIKQLIVKIMILMDGKHRDASELNRFITKQV